jgi:hypothetical protein
VASVYGRGASAGVVIRSTAPLHRALLADERSVPACDFDNDLDYKN